MNNNYAFLLYIAHLGALATRDNRISASIEWNVKNLI